MIRDATPGDAAAVTALWGVCGLTRPWNDPLFDFTRALDGASSTVLVIERADAIVASVMVGDDGHRGWVYYLGVDPAERGQGMGRALMTASEAWLKARGVPKLQLMVRADNAAALEFYQALGVERQTVMVLGRRL